MDLNEHKILIENLIKELKADRVIETHISTVILTKEFAYKIKKPVNFGFLDFSTLDKRKFFCSEEVRLNSRLTKNLYLNTLAIYGTILNPSLKEKAKIIEYVVKMKRFSDNSELDKIAEKSGLSDEIIEKIAIKVANFHKNLTPIKNDDFGKAEVIFMPIKENFLHIEYKFNNNDLKEIKRWSFNEFEKLKPILNNRKAKGFIKECHGDMHLRNIALIEGEINIFDCIEFNPYFQNIDVMSDFSFLLMDLEFRGMKEVSYLALNIYLEITSDYEGVKLINFYKSYRAMVRAKVSALSINENLSEKEKNKLISEFKAYVELAKSYMEVKPHKLIITYGFSGSGKSVYTKKMLKDGFIRIRSDSERMKLFSSKDRYSNEATQKTYEYLANLAKTILRAGFSVIVDATFLKKYQRELFKDLAKELNVEFKILEFKCDIETLRERVSKRNQQKSDISEATLEVLEKQFLNYEPLTKDELKKSVIINQ